MDHKMIQTLNNHEERITNLESSYHSLRTSQSELQVTVMKEGQHTRDLLDKLVDHTLEVKVVKQQNKHEERMKLWAIIGGSLASGGFLYMIISHFLL